jgi:hypothetical protein
MPGRTLPANARRVPCMTVTNSVAHHGQVAIREIPAPRALEALSLGGPHAGILAAQSARNHAWAQTGARAASALHNLTACLLAVACAAHNTSGHRAKQMGLKARAPFRGNGTDMAASPGAEPRSWRL